MLASRAAARGLRLEVTHEYVVRMGVTSVACVAESRAESPVLLPSWQARWGGFRVLASRSAEARSVGAGCAYPVFGEDD